MERAALLKVDAHEDGVGGEDAADCLRYMVGAKTQTISNAVVG
jgi:hypothetical protein